jgi:DNA-binding Lrp family transcriptional regulator
MTGLSEADRRLLDEIQQDFPLDPRPYWVIGRRCGLTEVQTIRSMRGYLSGGLVRDVSALLDTGKIGYHSTLAALRVPADRLETLAAAISRHPGVSHNYIREHAYNLWFTLALPREKSFTDEIDALLDQHPVEGCLILPALRTFKLRVNFRFQDGGRSPGAGGTCVPEQTLKGRIELGEPDKRLLAILQETLPLLPEPWKAIAPVLGCTEPELIASIERLKGLGVIRRISAVLRHRRAGFGANGMACFNLPEERIEAAGEAAAQFAEVSHCYQRRTYPQWPYPLYAMVHARSKPECDARIREIAERIGCTDVLVLYSSREIKKERVKYFKERT